MDGVDKKTIGQKALNAIFRGDDAKTFVESLWTDQVMPMIGDILEDLCGQVIHAVFYDDEYYTPRSKREKRRRHDYSSHSRRDSRSRRRSRDDDDDNDRSDLGPRDTDRVRFDSRGEAEDMLRVLADICKDDGEASVRDFYSEKKIISTNYNNSHWGWTDPRDIRKARTVKRGKYWYIVLPRPVHLDDDDEEDEDD